MVESCSESQAVLETPINEIICKTRIKWNNPEGTCPQSALTLYITCLAGKYHDLSNK